MDDDARRSCVACGAPRARSICSRCRSVRFCDKKCLKLGWPSHKAVCRPLAAGVLVRTIKPVEAGELDANGEVVSKTLPVGTLGHARGRRCRRRRRYCWRVLLPLPLPLPLPLALPLPLPLALPLRRTLR